VTRAPRRPRTSPPPGRARAFPVDAAAPAAARWAGPATLALLALFALGLAAFVTGPHRVGDVFTESDFYGAYGPGARAILHGRLDPSRYGVVGPVYELALAFTGLVVRDLFTAAELLSLAAMTFTLWAWGRIVRQRAGALAGLLAVALLAANAQVFRYGYSATTDALALALQAGALALLLGPALGARRAAAAGAVAALAFLTRYNAGVLLPAGLVAVMAGWTAAPPDGRRRRALAFAAGFAAPVLPWIAFSLLSGAHFAFKLHHNIAYEVFAHARGITWDTYEQTMESQFPTPWSVFARDPGAVIGRIAFNLWDHLRLDAVKLTGLPLAAAAAAGLWLGRRDGALARLAPVWLAAGLTFLALVPAFHSERYSLAVLPAWVALAAAGLGSTRWALPVGARGVWLKPLLALLVFVPSLRASVGVQHRGLSQLPVETLDAAAQARARFAPGDRVYARKPHFAWIAGLRPVPMPFVESLAELAADARRDSVRWLWFSWPEAELRPAFAWLLDTTAVVPGLERRATTTHHPAVLYEIGPGFGADPAWLADPAERNAHLARAMLSIDETDWRARVIASMDAQRKGHWEEAQPWLEQARRLRPDEEGIAILLADNLVHLHRTAEARTLYYAMQRKDPANAQAQLGLGWAAAVDGDPVAAAHLWRPVIEFAADPGTLDGMAAAFRQVGDAASLAAVAERRRDLGLPGAR
jgi:hypothetical protein